MCRLSRVGSLRRSWAWGLPLGLFVGLTFAARAPAEWGYPGLALLFAATTLAFVVFAREAPFAAEAMRAPKDWAVAMGRFFAGFANRDFTLAFVSRALVFLGYFLITNFAFYILQDVVGAAKLPNGSVKIAVSILGTVQMVTWLMAAPAAGWLADRFNCTKRVISAAAVGMGFALAIPFLFPTWGGMLALYVVSGAFFGSYISLDLALMSLVLPDKASEGRDIAILTMASTGPQLLSPMVAGLIITRLRLWRPVPVRCPAVRRRRRCGICHQAGAMRRKRAI